MSWVAVGVSVAGAIGGGILSNKAAKKSAKAQKKALKYQMRADALARKDMEPWRETGGQALNAYARAMGLPGYKPQTAQQFDYSQYPGLAQYAPAQAAPTAPEDRYGGFYESPGYQFRFDEGNRAVDRGASARGLLLSGAQNKALTRFAQGAASDEFGRYTENLRALAGLGSNAATNTAQFGLTSANTVGNSMVGVGDARASGYLNKGNTFSNVANIFADGWTRSRKPKPKTA